MGVVLLHGAAQIPPKTARQRHRRSAVIYVSRHPDDLTAGMTFILKPLHLAPDNGKGVGSGTRVQNWQSGEFIREEPLEP